MQFRLFILFGFFVVGVNLSCHSTAPVLSPGTEILPIQASLSPENWDVIYDGFGSVAFESDKIVLAPKAATAPGETHAALVLSSKTQDCPVKDFDVTIKATTLKQLRSGRPNPWEVFWIFFNYNPQASGKTTNYFILKTNGIELGKALAQVGQIFLVTKEVPKLEIGREIKYRLRKTGAKIVISINDEEVLLYEEADSESKKIYDQPGSIGLYTEDAIVEVGQVGINSLDEKSCPF